EVQAGATGHVDHRVTRAKAERAYSLDALRPLGIAGHRIEPGGDVVALRLLAVRLDQALLRAAGLAPHLGLRAFPGGGLDSSLNRHHLDIADALDPVLEQVGRDGAHDAREVDLDPHHGV